MNMQTFIEMIMVDTTTIHEIDRASFIEMIVVVSGTIHDMNGGVFTRLMSSTIISMNARP